MRLAVVRAFAPAVAIALCAATVIPASAAAQTSPLHTGGWIISGGAGLSHQTVDDSDNGYTTLSLAPSALYFATPKVAIGGSALFGYGSGASTWTYGVGPEVRYFIADSAAKLLPFVRASITPRWVRASVSPRGGTTTVTARTTTATAAVGLTQIVAMHVGVTGEAYFERNVLHSDIDAGGADMRTSTYGVRFGLTIFMH